MASERRHLPFLQRLAGPLVHLVAELAHTSSGNIATSALWHDSIARCISGAAAVLAAAGPRLSRTSSARALVLLSSWPGLYVVSGFGPTREQSLNASAIADARGQRSLEDAVPT